MNAKALTCTGLKDDIFLTEQKHMVYPNALLGCKMKSPEVIIVSVCRRN